MGIYFVSEGTAHGVLCIGVHDKKIVFEMCKDCRCLLSISAGKIATLAYFCFTIYCKRMDLKRQLLGEEYQHIFYKLNWTFYFRNLLCFRLLAVI